VFEFLKERGSRFYEEAKGDFEKGYYDFCLFHTEQMLQLLLKHAIATKTDDFPRTHSLSRLFKEVGSLYGKNISTITALEQAYTGARYIDIEFDKEIAEEVLKFGEKFLNLFEELIHNGYGNS
jgi:HEPN domain-containing protein